MSNQVGKAQSTKPTPILTQELVDIYAQINSQCSTLQKERDRLRDDVVAAMEAGQDCPDKGPYLLVLSYQERATVSWKDICYAVVDLMGDKLKTQAMALIATLLSGKKQVGQITVSVNPIWEAHK